MVLGRTGYLYTKVNSKLVTDLNVKPKVTTYRRSQENFCDSELDQDVLDVTPEAQFINVKLINWKNQILQTSKLQKTLLKKKKPWTGRNICEAYVEGLVSRK